MNARSDPDVTSGSGKKTKNFALPLDSDRFNCVLIIKSDIFINVGKPKYFS